MCVSVSTGQYSSTERLKHPVIGSVPVYMVSQGIEMQLVEPLHNCGLQQSGFRGKRIVSYSLSLSLSVFFSLCLSFSFSLSLTLMCTCTHAHTDSSDCMLQWLLSIGIDQSSAEAYAVYLREERVDDRVLDNLTLEQLSQIGISRLGHRMLIHNCLHTEGT